MQAGSAFNHHLFLHGSDEELVGTVVPFLRAGVEAGDGVVVCCRHRTAGVLLDALGYELQIAYLDYDDTYNTPIAAIAAYQELVDSFLSAGAQHVRVTAEAVYDRSLDERREWARYEAVGNHAMEAYPVSAICLYDTRLVPADLLAVGRLTHPSLIVDATTSSNPDYMPPAEFLQHTDQALPDPVEADPPDLDMATVSGLDDLRTELELCLFRTTHMAHETADLILAVNEVAANAIRHGAPPVSVRLWVRPGRCVCTITDHGSGITDPFAGYIWPGALNKPPTHGMGLWLARRLCDHVDIVNHPDGCTVRLTIERGHTSPHLPHHQGGR